MFSFGRPIGYLGYLWRRLRKSIIFNTSLTFAGNAMKVGFDMSNLPVTARTLFFLALCTQTTLLLTLGSHNWGAWTTDGHYPRRIFGVSLKPYCNGSKMLPLLEMENHSDLFSLFGCLKSKTFHSTQAPLLIHRHNRSRVEGTAAVVAMSGICSNLGRML